jgi:hypothetical protein
MCAASAKFCSLLSVKRSNVGGGREVIDTELMLNCWEVEVIDIELMLNSYYTLRETH